MAKSGITFNKLIVTVHGEDYAWNNIPAARLYPDAVTTWESGFEISSQDTFKSYVKTYGYHNGYEEILAMYQADMIACFNIRPYMKLLSDGERIHIWREDVGRNHALVVQKRGANNFDLYIYQYGTYSLLPFGGFNPVDYPNYTLIPESPVFFNFGYDDSSDRYILYQTMYQQYTSDVPPAYYAQIYWIFTERFNATLSNLLTILLTGNTPQPGPTPGPDQPYGDDDYDEYVGGDGDHDDTSDQIDLPAIPIAAATRSGMCTAYVPTWGEIQTVADALLDPNIFQILANNVVKFSDVIIGLSIFPCVVPASTSGAVKANVLGMEIGTGVTAHIADDQFVTIDCGTLDIDEYWGNCLDYNPYTRISIFLPFCGMYELDVDEVMGRTIGVSYRIDIMSGACLATIKIDGSVFYQYSGQCSAQVPLSSVSFDQFLASMIELGVATATGVGAVGAAGGAVKEAETAFQAAGTSGSGGSALMEAREHLSSVKTQSANSIADATVGAVMGSKGFYQHAGAMSGSPGFLGVRTPYIIIKRPEQLVPSMYGKFNGFPCNTTAVLGDLVGFTVVDDIRLNIPEATVQEIIECEQLLKGGVVI